MSYGRCLTVLPRSFTPRAPRTPGRILGHLLAHPGQGEQPPAERFEWTQYPGHEPGAEILGQPATALELGPAEGKEAVVLARQGVQVTWVDLSPVQVARAGTWWKDVPGLSFVHADVTDCLAADTTAYDAIYSVWGAVRFTDPEHLFPLIAQRLAPRGVFAFSQAEPPIGAYRHSPCTGSGWRAESVN